MKKDLWIIFCLCISVNPIFAFFERDLRLLTMQDGLSDNTVSYIHKDQNGFMWFGTDNGLSRYDGKQIKNFVLNQGSFKIKKIQESGENLLWILANGNLYCFDRTLERLLEIHFEVQIPYIRDIQIANDSSCWVITGGEMIQLEMAFSMNENDTFSYVSVGVKNEYKNLLPNDPLLECIALSGDNKKLGVCSNKGDILILDPLTLECIRQPKKIDVLKDHLTVHHLLFSEDALWISTLEHGLFHYLISDDTIHQYTYTPENKKHSLSHTDVFQLVTLSNNRFLAVTWNGYTLLVPDKKDPHIYTTEIYNNTASQIHRNLETHMISAYCDPAGILWIGTQGGGVLCSDLRRQFYESFHQDVHNEICGMTADNTGKLWLATFHGGIMRSNASFDPQEKLSFETVFHNNKSMLCAARDLNGILWFGGSGSTLISYDPDISSFQSYPVIIPDEPEWSGDLWTIYTDGSENLWIGTSNGLLSFNIKSKRYTLKRNVKGFIRTIVGSSDTSLWIGGREGLIHYYPDKNKIIKGFEHKSGISEQEIRSLFLDSKKEELFIGYTDGLGIFSIQKDSISSFFTTNSGLCNNFIGCVTNDNREDLWIGSNSGVSRFSERQSLFYHYYISGSNRSAFLYKDYIFFGNNKNLTYFNPNEIRLRPERSNTVFMTQLIVNDKPVEIGDRINGQILLDKGFSYTKQLNLNYDNNNFSLLFSNLSYSSELQKYQYRLSPFQSEWLIANEGEKISYANLPSGHYCFEVKNIFPDGTNSALTNLDIIINPHWSKTLWFRMLLLVLIFLVFYSQYRRIKLKQIRIAREEQLKHELSIAHLEHEQQKQINKERANFFTNASHELRTPLTLILSPLQELLDTEKISDRIYNRLALVYNNATSMSALVNHLLDVQKFEAGMMKLHVTKVDFIALVKKEMEAFKHMAELRQTHYSLHTVTEELWIWIDESQVKSLVRNLLSNAFKYTENRGSIVVNIEKKELDGKCVCVFAIADDGPGIPSSMQHNIFDSFITGNHIPSFSTQTGIGLRIVKHVIDLHRGTIAIESDTGKGTKFIICLPIDNDHFTKEEFVNPDVCELPEWEYGEYIIQETATQNNEHKPYKLLIIEDNNEIRNYICSLFKEYTLLEACNGEEGFEIAKKEIPDLIISDLMMPVKDGFECAREIREWFETAHIPIVILTAKQEEEDLLFATRIGIDDYIIKPFNPEILRSKVENLIRLRSSLKRIYTKTLMLKYSENKEEDAYDEFMQKIINIVEANLTNPEFNIKKLASNLCVSQPTLYRKVKQQSNLSIIELVRSIRISKAASLLIQKQYSVQEVAEQVGYNDLGTFRKHFANQFGISPSKYSQ